MTQGAHQSKQAIDQLVGLGRIRVWSVVITVFGDAVVPRGGVVASTSLAALSAEMGVKPEAFRVAMSRLTKDGWLQRSKKGRLSFFQLSEKGKAVFGPATTRIYAPYHGSADGWKLAVLPSSVDGAPDGAIALGGRSYLTPKDVGFEDALSVSGEFDVVPNWVKDRIGSTDLVQAYGDLYSTLSALDVTGSSPLSAAVLRTLIVHQWRRLVLRHADLPPEFFPEGWRGEDCRTIVHQLLADLAPAADAWFDSEIL